MGGFRLQMAHELSCGVLYALQSDVSFNCETCMKFLIYFFVAEVFMRLYNH